MRTIHHSIYIILVSLLLCSACTQKKKDTPEEAQLKKRAAAAVDFSKYGIKDLTKVETLKEIISQTWENTEDVADSRGQTVSEDIDIVSRGFCFFSDGTMIKNPRGDMRQGTWELDDSKKPYVIVIKYKDGQTEKYQIAKVSPETMLLKDPASDEKKLVEYSAPALNYTDLKSDPFYSTNNQWRIKPTRAETDEELKKRLKDCIHFFVLFYDHNIQTQAKTINFTGLPTCFRWYAGGILLYKEDKIPTKWKNCFYTDAQAMKAYKMADDLLSKKYTWPKGETNWLKQNVFVLKQMDANL